jgi:hypothetical protein
MVALAAGVSGCAPRPQPVWPAASHAARAIPGPGPLQPGAVINQIKLTTGAAGVASLWELCGGLVNTTVVCLVPAGGRLGVGPSARLADGAASWDRQPWQLFLDDEPIDLPAFGTFDYVRREPSRDGGADIAWHYRAWDVVMIPQPDRHSLRAVRCAAGATWAAPSLARLSATPRQPAPQPACQWVIYFSARTPYVVAQRE